MIRTSDIALEPRPFPSWARVETTHVSDIQAGVAAGAGLAALDALIRSDASWTGAFRHRMALAAAVATLAAFNRVEDDRALRDAWLLRRTGDDPGPAGRTLQAWRLLAGHSNPLVLETLHKAADAFGIKCDASLDQIVVAANEQKIDGGAAVIAAAETTSSVVKLHPRAEPVALWLADALLAKHLRWPIAVPLLACQNQHASLKCGGRRVRPGDPEWIKICCLAYARAAAQACDLANDLARSAEKLLAAAPRLRAKESDTVIAALLADDAVTATSLKTSMSDRGLRRLFDRLVELDAIRELSGRPTFRIYGL